MQKAISVGAILLLALAVTVFLVNCGGGGGIDPQQSGTPGLNPDVTLPQSEMIAEKQGFSLRAWADENGFFGDSQLSLDVLETGAGTQVSVLANAAGMKSAQFEITFDGQSTHPVSSENGEWPGCDESQLLRLTVLNVPNAVHHGTIRANPDSSPGVNGGFVVLTVMFEPGAQTNLRAASSAPTGANSVVPDLAVDTVTGDVTFSYYNVGDYDQNSEVGLSDLTPIALNFGEAGPFGYTTALSVIDGDGNGEVNLADITPIAINYSNDIRAWTVYAGTLDDYPDGPGDGNGTATEIGEVLYSGLAGNSAVDRITFAGQFPGLIAPIGLLAWLRPVGADETEGIASATFNLQTGVADNDPPEWESTVGITAAGAGFGQVTVSWGTATDALSEPVTYIVYHNEGTTVDFGTATTVDVEAPAVNTVVTGLADGTEYAFAVRAKDSAIPPNEDDNTNEMTATPGSDATPPVWTGATAVGALDVIPLDGGVRVVWGEATDADSPAVTYVIYYNEGDTVDLGTATVIENLGSDPPNPELDQFIEIGGLANDTQHAFVVQAKDAAAPPNQEGNTNTVTITPLATADMPTDSTGDTTFDGPMTIGVGNEATLNCDAGTEATFEFMGDLTIDGDLLPQECDITIIVHGDLTVNGSINHQIADPQPDGNGDLPSLKIVALGNVTFGAAGVLTGQGNTYLVDDPDDLISPEEAEADADNWDSDEFEFNMNPDEAAGGGGSFKGGSKATSATQYFGPAWTWRPTGNWTVPTPPRNITRIILRIYQRRGVTKATDFNLTGPPGAPGDPGGGCDAVGGVGEDNRFKLRWHTGRKLELNNCTIKLGDGGAGGVATTPGDCCNGIATGGNGGSPNNKFRITAGGSIQIASFTLNPGNGGIGGEATATAKDGVVKCPGDNGCNADAIGGDGGDVPRWGVRIRGNVFGTGSFNLGTAEGGRGGNGTANSGKGGDGLPCCDGGNGGLAIADGGKGGNSTFTGGGGAGGTPGGAQGGDGGTATANAKDGGKGGDCFKLPAGNGGLGGDADAFGGLPGTATGTNAADGTDGEATANAGNGGNGGNGCPFGAGGPKGTPTADGTPANTNTPVDGADGIEWPVGCQWIWCIPLVNLVPDPLVDGTIPNGFGGIAEILDQATQDPIGTVPFNWSFDGAAGAWYARDIDGHPSLQMWGEEGGAGHATLEIEIISLELVGQQPIAISRYEILSPSAFNTFQPTGPSGKMLLLDELHNPIPGAEFLIPPINSYPDATPVGLDRDPPDSFFDVYFQIDLTPAQNLEFWDALCIWDP